MKNTNTNKVSASFKRRVKKAMITARKVWKEMNYMHRQIIESQYSFTTTDGNKSFVSKR